MVKDKNKILIKLNSVIFVLIFVSNNNNVKTLKNNPIKYAYILEMYTQINQRNSY